MPQSEVMSDTYHWQWHSSDKVDFRQQLLILIHEDHLAQTDNTFYRHTPWRPYLSPSLPRFDLLSPARMRLWLSLVNRWLQSLHYLQVLSADFFSGFDKKMTPNEEVMTCNKIFTASKLISTVVCYTLLKFWIFLVLSARESIYRTCRGSKNSVFGHNPRGMELTARETQDRCNNHTDVAFLWASKSQINLRASQISNWNRHLIAYHRTC